MADDRRLSVHVAGPVPARLRELLRQHFTLVDAAAGADGIVALFNTIVDERYLALAGPQLRIIANYAAGTNNVDLDAARSRGVTVTNTPGVLTRATAELAVTLMLALLRRVVEGDRLVRAREPWSMEPEFMLGEGLDGKVVTIVGPGRIGQETARLASAFGARVDFVGRSDDLVAAVARANLVSIHCPLLPETRHLIDDVVLRRMQPTAVLVNTARGPIIDERALADALVRGDLGGAALDVYEFEPHVTETLISLRNVVLTPHIGSATRHTREKMGTLVVDSLRAVLVEARRPATAVV